MKNGKNILLIIGCLIIIALIVVFSFMNNKQSSSEFIENVKDIYTSAIEESDAGVQTNTKGNINYTIKLNEKGEVVYLLATNGTEKIKLGDPNGKTPITLSDIKKEKIDKVELNLGGASYSDEYEVIKTGKDGSFKERGYYMQGPDTLTITLGQKNSGTYSMSIASVTSEEGNYVVTVKVTEPKGDAQIQVLSNPYITIKFKDAKINNLVVKDTKGEEFKNLIIPIEGTPKRVEKDNTQTNSTKEETKVIEPDSSIIKETPNVVEPTVEDSSAKKVVKTKCNKGEYLDNGECYPCPNNTYGADGIVCTSCPVDTCTSGGAKSEKECRSCASLIDPVKPDLATE